MCCVCGAGRYGMRWIPAVAWWPEMDCIRLWPSLHWHNRERPSTTSSWRRFLGRVRLCGWLAGLNLSSLIAVWWAGGRSPQVSELDTAAMLCRLQKNIDVSIQSTEKWMLWISALQRDQSREIYPLFEYSKQSGVYSNDDWALVILCLELEHSEVLCIELTEDRFHVVNTSSFVNSIIFLFRSLLLWACHRKTGFQLNCQQFNLAFHFVRKESSLLGLFAFCVRFHTVDLILNPMLPKIAKKWFIFQNCQGLIWETCLTWELPACDFDVSAHQTSLASVSQTCAPWTMSKWNWCQRRKAWFSSMLSMR